MLNINIKIKHKQNKKAPPKKKFSLCTCKFYNQTKRCIL